MDSLLGIGISRLQQGPFRINRVNLSAGGLSKFGTSRLLSRMGGASYNPCSFRWVDLNAGRSKAGTSRMLPGPRAGHRRARNPGTAPAGPLHVLSPFR